MLIIESKNVLLLVLQNSSKRPLSYHIITYRINLKRRSTVSKLEQTSLNEQLEICLNFDIQLDNTAGYPAFKLKVH